MLASKYYNQLIQTYTKHNDPSFRCRGETITRYYNIIYLSEIRHYNHSINNWRNFSVGMAWHGKHFVCFAIRWCWCRFTPSNWFWNLFPNQCEGCGRKMCVCFFFFSHLILDGTIRFSIVVYVFKLLQKQTKAMRAKRSQLCDKNN